MIEELNGELLQKESENEKMLEKIDKLEKENNKKYFDDEWDLLVGSENNIESSEDDLEDEEDEDDESEYILVSLPKNAEELLGEDRFMHLEDDLSEIEGIDEIFIEDEDEILIDRGTCSISEKIIKIEILNIYLKLLIESIEENED